MKATFFEKLPPGFPWTSFVEGSTYITIESVKGATVKMLFHPAGHGACGKDLFGTEIKISKLNATGM